MPEPIGKVYFKPDYSYNFKLTIKDYDYSQDLFEVRIVSSITSAYQIIILGIFVDPDEIILEKIYGQDPLKLSAILKGQTKGGEEQIDFELMAIRNSLQIQTRPDSTSGGKIGEQVDRVPFNIITVCRSPFKSMTSLVNQVYTAKTVKEIVEALVTESGSGVTLKYDTEGTNKEVLSQVVVPPTTLYKAIEYLDNAFGLYYGVPAVFCMYDNILHVRNLSNRLKQAQTFTVYHLSSQENDEKFTENLDGKTFYSFNPIQTSYAGNSIFANLAKNLEFIVRPSDALYTTISLDLETICEQSLPSAGKEIFIDPNMTSRSRYYIDIIGNEYDDTFAVSMVTKLVSSISTISINLERNLKIENLMNVGEPVKLNIKTLEYITLAGMYILKSSDLLFSRKVDWESTAKINLMRTHNLDK